MRTGILSKNTYALFALILIWGASYPIYKVALMYTPPLLFAGMRSLIGGVLLAIFLTVWNNNTLKYIKWKKNWKKYCLSALFNTILFFGLQTVGLVYISSGLLTIFIYFQPVLLSIFAWYWLDEDFHLTKFIGLMIGFLGIIIVSIESFSDKVSLIGSILGLLTAFFWALGTCYVKKVRNEINTFWMIAIQNIIGGAVLIGVGHFSESWSDILWKMPYVLGLSYGAILAIPIAYIIYYQLFNSGDANKIGSSTFLIPIVAIFFGVIFLKESITMYIVIGLILVTASVYFVNKENKSEN